MKGVDKYGRQQDESNDNYAIIWKLHTLGCRRLYVNMLIPSQFVSFSRKTEPAKKYCNNCNKLQSRRKYENRLKESLSNFILLICYLMAQ